MKNQYFGDVNDYRKYGLLRCLQQGHDPRLLVAWMLTPNDGRADGEARKYLKHPGQWRRFDADLYDGLSAMDRPRAQRRVAAIERTRLIPRASFFDQLVPDEAMARDKWGKRLVEASQTVDLVFLDPDNGIEVPSRRIGRKDSNKYVAWPEIVALWKAGCSLLIYQHFPHERRDAFVARMLNQLQKETNAPNVEAFRTPHVVFLLAVQGDHRAQQQRAAHAVGSRWPGQIRSTAAPTASV